MVFIPSVAGGFEIELSQIEKTNDFQSFSAVLTGPQVPTTEIRGNARGTQPRTILGVSAGATRGDSIVEVDGSLVELVRGAHYRSSATVELRDEEKYKIETSARSIRNIEVVEVVTGEPIVSLETIMSTVDTPIRHSKTEEGISFSRQIDETTAGSVTIDSSDQNHIRSTTALGYEVAFADGTSALFGIDANRSMVGVFSDGSVSIRDDSGSGIHVTNDGWIIDEPRRGELKVFRKNTEGDFESPSIEDVSKSKVETQEIREILERIINRASIRPSDDQSETESSDRRDGSSVNLEASRDRIESVTKRYESVDNVKEAIDERRLRGTGLSAALAEVLETVTGRIDRVTGTARSDGTNSQSDALASSPSRSEENTPTLTSTPVPTATSTPTLAPSRSRPAPTPTLAPSRSRPTPTPTLAPSRSRPTPTSTLAPSRSRPTPTSTLAPSRSQPTPTSTLAPSRSRPTPTSTLAPSRSRPTPNSTLAPSRSRPTPTLVPAPPPTPDSGRNSRS